jgi:hypothetical protein
MAARSCTIVDMETTVPFVDLRVALNTIKPLSAAIQKQERVPFALLSK